MGQRLVMQVFQNKETMVPLAACYFHWDGYTGSTILDVQNFTTAYKELKQEDPKMDEQLRVVRSFEKMNSYNYDEERVNQLLELLNAGNEMSGYMLEMYTGKAGLEPGSKLDMESKYPNEKFELAKDRNLGLISTTIGEIHDSLAWAEATANVYLDEEEWNFDAFYLIDIDSYCEWYEESPEKFEKYLEEAEEFDPCVDFKWDDIQMVEEMMEKQLKSNDCIIERIA